MYIFEEELVELSRTIEEIVQQEPSDLPTEEEVEEALRLRYERNGIFLV